MAPKEVVFWAGNAHSVWNKDFLSHMPRGNDKKAN